MKYTPKIRKAIRFAIKVHEVDQKQKRKGKDVAYITHPMTVGLILAQVGGTEDIIIAGLLHDTVEDCSKDYPVTLEIIKKEFGNNISVLVESITEKESNLSWAKRKKIALEHVRDFTNDMVLLKSADILANGTEIVDDYAEKGDEMFERFNASKEKKLENQIKFIEKLLNQWENNYLAEDLKKLKSEFTDIK